MKKSAAKRNRQAKEARLANREVKSAVRTAVKDFDAACASGDKVAAQKALALSAKLLDSASTKGIIHSNTSDRKKSRMALKFNKLA